MNMYGHISYMIIHVYKYLYMIIYIYTYSWKTYIIHMHEKFFIDIIDFIFEYIVLIYSQIKCTKLFK